MELYVFALASHSPKIMIFLRMWDWPWLIRSVLGTEGLRQPYLVIVLFCPIFFFFPSTLVLRNLFHLSDNPIPRKFMVTILSSSHALLWCPVQCFPIHLLFKLGVLLEDLLTELHVFLYLDECIYCIAAFSNTCQSYSLLCFWHHFWFWCLVYVLAWFLILLRLILKLPFRLLLPVNYHLVSVYFVSGDMVARENLPWQGRIYVICNK